MPWISSSDVERFLARAEEFLAEDVVANNGLLTEARFWARHSKTGAGARFGWWESGSEVTAAFALLPDHPVICSRLPAAAAPALLAALAEAVPPADLLSIDATDAEAVTQALAARGKGYKLQARMTLLRLRSTALRPRPPADGHPRLAEIDDLPLLRTWFTTFRAQHPEDRSDVAFVIDQPFRDRGVVVWETGGRPVAMASRTPLIAGMVRMGLAYQPTDGTRYADSAFDAACAEATRVAETVLVLSGSTEATKAHQALGFEPVSGRLLLRAE